MIFAIDGVLAGTEYRENATQKSSFIAQPVIYCQYILKGGTALSRWMSIMKPIARGSRHMSAPPKDVKPHAVHLD
jgi:hypothetical protein